MHCEDDERLKTITDYNAREPTSKEWGRDIVGFRISEIFSTHNSYVNELIFKLILTHLCPNCILFIYVIDGPDARSAP